ncbi:Maf family protein [Thiomonas sp.]|uniref:Maf family protein n=1 Tax=Thiomonas sp. TaxID=2047785 RepID=UPI00258F6533|nr:Maf family protein [Thiomonas sp.]
MHARPRVDLASASPRRQELLRQIGVDFALLAPSSDEDAEALEQVLRGESAAAYVTRVTRLKLDAAVARQIRRGLPDAPILCADTTVALGRSILGKPGDADEARAMLARLSGRAHRVLTAVALRWARTGRLHTAEVLSTSQVRFAALTPTQIDDYVASGEPFGKAGAYAVQGRAACFIQHLRGSYSGIMGLPLFETAQLLRQAGIPV